MGLTLKEIAIRLQIGVGTAHRLYARYVELVMLLLRHNLLALIVRSLTTSMNCMLLHSYMRTQPYTFMKFVPKILIFEATGVTV